MKGTGEHVATIVEHEREGELDLPPGRGSTVLRALLGIVVAGVVLTLAAATAVFAFSFEVNGPSMRPTLSDGQRIDTDPFDSTVRRFDVVALNEPGQTTKARIVKRVVGLPGDEIEIRPRPDADPQVRLRPGGQGPWYEVVQSTWAHDWMGSAQACCTPDGKTTTPSAPVRIPPGHFFVLGDNTALSVDSRAFGWVDQADIIGTIRFRSWPLDLAGSLPNLPTLQMIAN